ncbi:MAG: hypothetical protein ACE5KM_12720 [Planctomycetaceae bacterium]
MAVNKHELDSFHSFVVEKMNNAGAPQTLEACLRQWRTERERAETLSDIRQAEEEIESGQGYTLEEADEKIRAQFGYPPRKETA